MCGQGVCQTLFPSGHFLAPLGTPPPLRQRSPDPVNRPGVCSVDGENPLI
jgi:hypothetical protein